MNSKKNRKSYLSFAGNSVIRNPKTPDDKYFDVKIRIDELYREIRLKDNLISGLTLNSNELKANNEQLLIENDMLRTKLTQYYGKDLDKFAEKHKKEIEGYMNDIKKLRKLLTESEKKWKNARGSADLERYKEELRESGKMLEKVEDEKEKTSIFLKERDEIIEKLKKELMNKANEEKNEEIEKLKLEIMKKSEEIASKDQLIAEKDALIFRKSENVKLKISFKVQNLKICLGVENFNFVSNF